MHRSKGAAKGNRIVSWGIHIQVTGDGHGYREFRSRPFGYRELAPGFRRLKAERPNPEELTTVAVTRHLMNHDRSIYSGLRFPFETLQRFGWQVAGGGKTAS